MIPLATIGRWKNWLQPWLFSLALLVAPGVGQGGEVQVVGLRHRTAAELLPVLKAHFPPPVVLSGLADQLIVQGTPEQVNAIKALLDTLDTQPKDLLIQVDHSGEGTFQEQNHGVVIRGNDQGVIQGGVRFGQQKGQNHQEALQTIRVMEGGRATIQVGESRPVQQAQSRWVGGMLVEERRSVMQSAGLSLYVEPRLSGNHEVTLAIYPENSRFIDRNGSREMAQAATVIRGRLGEWMELGGLNQEQTSQNSGILSDQHHDQQSTRRIRVKVSLAQ